MKETLIELRVEIAGGPHARYEHNFQTGGPQLVEVVYPADRLPGDLCAVQDTLTEEKRPLGALLLGNLSHAPDCLVWGRLLGMIERRAGQQQLRHLIAVAEGDRHFDGLTSIEDLSGQRRNQVELFFRLDVPGAPVEVQWSGAAAACALVHEARQAFRLAQAGNRSAIPMEPAWKPMRGVKQTAVSRETERHTAAEYAFYTLPYRFQKYIEEHLALDERILYGLHRPAMRSTLNHTFLRHKHLEEGVFVVGDQQVAQVVELMPPGRAGIRYGFVARSSAPERLEAVELHPLTSDVLGLTVTWRASGGSEKVMWEFPMAQRSALEAALDLLGGWLPLPSDVRLRRAALPEPPESFAPLYDPAANHPTETEPLAARLEAALANTLRLNETILNRCLLPAWISGRGAASLLALTGQRLLVIPDPVDLAASSLGLELPLHAIASLEFCSTLIRAYLKVFVPEQGHVHEHTIQFGKTLGAMNGFYLALRQALAATPPHYIEVTTAVSNGR